MLFLPGGWVGGAGTFLQAALEQIVTETNSQAAGKRCLLGAGSDPYHSVAQLNP